MALNANFMNTISNKLNVLNDTYLGSVPVALLGSSQFIKSSFNSGDSTDHGTVYMNSLFNLATNQLFTNSSGSLNYLQLPGSLANTQTSASYNISGPNIYVFDPVNNVYSAQSINGSSSFNSSSLNYTTPNPSSGNTPMTTDINLMELLLVAQNANVNTSLNRIPTSLYCLQALYAWYNLLDNNNWNNFTANGAVTFDVPDMTTNSGTITIGFTSVTLQIPKSGSTYSGSQLNSQNLIAASANPSDLATNIGTLMNYYIPFQKILNANINPFVARRLIHLSIILFNFNIALSYSLINATISNTMNTTPEYVSAIYKLLEAANANVSDTSNGTFQQLTQAVQQRLNQYNYYDTKLSSLNSNLTKLQTSVKSDINTLNSKQQYQNSIKKYLYGAIAVFVIICVSSALVYLTPISYKYKLITSASMIILAVITAFVLHYLLNNSLTKEGFDGAATVSTTDGLYTNIINLAANYGDLVYNQVDKYLDNTIVLTTTLDSYQLYGNVNYSLGNQEVYYTNAVNTLNNQDTNLQAAGNSVYLSQMRYSAIMNFIILMSLILSIFTTLYIASANYPTLQYWLFIIMLIAVLITLIVLFIELKRPVRTHAKQKYWAAADTSKLQ